MAELRDDVDKRISEFREDMNNRMAELRESVEKRIAEFREEMIYRMDEISRRLDRLESRFWWLLGILITMWVTIILAILVKG
jgi:DNA anti-recombination protein RmuC